MAEALFRRLIKKGDGIEAASAGVSAAHGFPASSNAAAALKPLGISMAGFCSQPLTEALIEKSDFLFAMTQSHLDIILTFFPDAANKTCLLTEFSGKADIPDPIGQDFNTYVKCRDQINAALPSVLDFVKKTQP